MSEEFRPSRPIFSSIDPRTARAFAQAVTRYLGYTFESNVYESNRRWYVVVDERDLPSALPFVGGWLAHKSFSENVQLSASREDGSKAEHSSPKRNRVINIAPVSLTRR